MIKGFRQIASLTAISRVFGFARDVAYSHFFGASPLMDAWTIAFKIPNLARRLFGEGAASASFIPIYSEELHKNPEKAKQLVNTVVTVLFVILAAMVLIGQGIIWGYYKFFSSTNDTRLVLTLSSIMLPYMLFVCMVAILAGILNVHRHFAAPAAAPIVLNICIITSILITGWVFNIKAREQVFFVAVAVLIAGLAQIAIQVRPLRSAGVSIRPGWQIHSDAFKKIIILMGPMILGLTVTQINTLADDLIAWWLSSSADKGLSFILLGRDIQYPLERGSVSHLYFAQRLYQLPLGIFGISLATAIFPVMSSYAARKDFSGLAEKVSHGLRSAIFIAIPATIGLAAVARPLISVAFEHGKFGQIRDDTGMVAWTLLFYTLGLFGYFVQQILTRAFYAMQDSKTPMKSALIAVFANIVLNLTLIWFLGTGGLALSTALCSYVQVVILVVVLGRSLRKRGADTLIFDGFTRTLLKTVAATVCMSVVIIIALLISQSWPNIFKLLLIVPSAAVSYLLAAKFLRIEMLSVLFSGKRSNNETTNGSIDD
ncbi:MAG: murein biosynthesis integral membrane protein MurJ [Planctomycetes bacterium]|nr:murein biosynthesis integral membrane protein MurJ [Planctomycetota bacterium]